ncbi:MAG TPA: hypothetical protein VMT37_16310 [Solirubrobacterales bacterium]|nr:hypothetical protein [Solirubrobacterales bacterium]
MANARRRLVLLLPLALLATALAAAPTASAAISPFGKPTGRDRALLRRRFLASHPKGFVIVGYHASVYFKFKYAGVYYMEKRNGEYVDSGVEIFRRAGNAWAPDRHPSATLEVNLAPGRYFYFATLSGSGSYRLLEENELGVPELRTSTLTEIQLKLSGDFGGRKGMRIISGEEQPGGASSLKLLGGNGSSTQTTPAGSYRCQFGLRPSEQQTSLSVGWRGKHELTVDLNLGDPVGTANPIILGGESYECVGAPEDPLGHEPWIELQAQLPNPPLGKPFDVPLSLEHSRSLPGRDESGALVAVDERSLDLTGKLHFALARIEPPYYN